MLFSVDGIASGLDTTKIVNAMLSIQQRQVDQLGARKQALAAEQTAFQGIAERLLGLRNVLSELRNTQDSVLFDRQAVVSNPALLSAAAGRNAAEGVHYLRVNSLARAHQIASQGYVSASSAITQGTLTIRVGSGASVTVTVDQTNNTLRGLADAINAASTDVTAAIINDGSGATPYRLLLTSTQTGSANTIEITNNLQLSSGDLVQPDFSGPAVQTASDASITLGNGPGAITVNSADNQFEDVIEGVTLKVLSADPDTEIALTVSRDTESAKTAIMSFVTAYNDLMDFIASQTRFDAASGSSGLLLGSRDATSIQEKVQRTISSAVAGIGVNMNRLSALGITFDEAGKLSVDTARLDEVLGGRIAGVSEDDINRLFALDGQSNHGSIAFVVGGTSTKEGTVQVDITQAAAQASMVATNALGDSTVIDETNNTFTITVDGRISGTLTLVSGTYTRLELAAHIQTIINADPSLSRHSVMVSLANNALQVTSDAYGSAANVEIGSGSALTVLGFDGSESGQGQDVAGTFIVNGVEETASGRGRLLVGDPSNAATADLRVRVMLTSSQVQPGSEATLTITRGLASRLDQVLGQILDPVYGQVKTIEDGIEQRIERIDERIAEFQVIMDSRRESLMRQFAALESLLSQLQSTSAFLAAQLNSVTGLGTTTSGK